MKTALLVMVHGSPKPESNTAVFKAVDLIVKQGAFAFVEVGYLDCNEPDIPTAIDNCVTKGAEGVIAVPYFLHTGKHVASDIPKLLEDARKRHPKVEFLMGSYVGKSEHVTDVLEQRAQTAIDK